MRQPWCRMNFRFAPWVSQGRFVRKLPGNGRRCDFKIARGHLESGHTAVFMPLSVLLAAWMFLGLISKAKDGMLVPRVRVCF